MRINVKPLTHWIIYRGYKVRFTERMPGCVTGVLTRPDGEVSFQYDPNAQRVDLPDEQIMINEYGWELSKETVRYES
jgi:hypothetical protein